MAENGVIFVKYVHQSLSSHLPSAIVAPGSARSGPKYRAAADEGDDWLFPLLMAQMAHSWWRQACSSPSMRSGTCTNSISVSLSFSPTHPHTLTHTHTHTLSLSLYCTTPKHIPALPNLFDGPDCAEPVRRRDESARYDDGHCVADPRRHVHGCGAAPTAKCW